MKRIDPTERAAFWIGRAVEAENNLRRWIARGECEMTRGAIGRARAWAAEASELAAKWLEKSDAKLAKAA
jgi:hypothetical protein